MTTPTAIRDHHTATPGPTPPMCSQTDNGYTCTLGAYHPGDHEAHSDDHGHVAHTWTDPTDDYGMPDAATFWRLLCGKVQAEWRADIETSRALKAELAVREAQIRVLRSETDLLRAAVAKFRDEWGPRGHINPRLTAILDGTDQ